MEISPWQGHQYKSNKNSSPGDSSGHTKPSDDKLTQYFEDLAAKALDLTKKYGLKDEFEMIRGEIKKHEVIQKSQSSFENEYNYQTYSSSDESDDSFEFRRQRKQKTPRYMKHYERPKKVAHPETPDYEKRKKRKLVLKKGEVTPHERLYALAARNQIKKDILAAEERAPPVVTKKFYPQVIRQYEDAKKYNKENHYVSKRDEEVEDQIECTFQPEITRSQRIVEGRRNAPIFAPLLTEEEKQQKQQQKLDEEMISCTFKPELNKKSIKMADEILRKKQIEEEQQSLKKPDIIPMKQQIRKAAKASMLFDVHSHTAQERLEKMRQNLHSRKELEAKDGDPYSGDSDQNVMTPEFEDAEEEADEVHMLPQTDSFVSENYEEEDIDQMIKQVIFENEFHK
ncbi:unnamed protein product [Moneuplotes crassus]|uniref:Uncharacterized protein n=1 Tax=Euplotes crassus TaxID=5936 RepID=A0AAD1XCT9_EUPCR|nr:unnamed protein product [Moneuplotes crassus]